MSAKLFETIRRYAVANGRPGLVTIIKRYAGQTTNEHRDTWLKMARGHKRWCSPDTLLDGFKPLSGAWDIGPDPLSGGITTITNQTHVSDASGAALVAWAVAHAPKPAPKPERKSAKKPAAKPATGKPATPKPRKRATKHATAPTVTTEPITPASLSNLTDATRTAIADEHTTE